mgnify:CR=1 FL=1
MLKRMSFTLIGALFGVASLMGILGSGETTALALSGLVGALVGGYIGYRVANR